MNRYVVLVRHGETEGNLRRIIQGTSEASGLTPQGYEQMLAVGTFLKSLFTKAIIWSSPMGRSTNAAKILAQETGFLGPGILDDLRQRDWGSSTGKSYDERTGETAFLGEPGRGLADDAEPISAIRKRLEQAIDLIKQSPVQNHIIVSHNELLNYFINFWQGARLRKQSFLSGEAMILRFKTGNLEQEIERTFFPPRLVYLKNTHSLLKVEKAISILKSHGLEPITNLDPKAQDHVVAIVLGDTPFGIEEANAFPRLRTVARFGVGTDNVDVKGLWEKRRISVSCTAGLATKDVAEFCLAMLIIMLREAHFDANKLKMENLWRAVERGLSLSDATIGIIGCGRIGLATARLLHLCGAKVLLWNRTWPPSHASPRSIRKFERVLTLAELASRCDAVSIHVALTPATYHLVDINFFNEIRHRGKSIVFVNTARGSVVDEEALLAAVQDGTVRAVALDVWSCERDATNLTVLALRNHPAVFATSHLASYTTGVRQCYALQCARNIVALVEGRRSEVERYIVNPSL